MSSSPEGYSIILKIFLTVICFFGSIVLYGLYKLLIKPKIRMQHYIKQGLPTFFGPIMGDAQFDTEGLEKHGDAQHFYKTQFGLGTQKAICFNFASVVNVLLCDPVIIKEFCLTPENYVKDEFFGALFDPLFGKGLLTAEGSRWKSQRKVFSNIFNFEYLKSALPSIQNKGQEILTDVQKQSLKEVDIMYVFQKITGEAVGRIFFGEELDQHPCEGRPLTEALAELLCDIGALSFSMERVILGSWVINNGLLPKYAKIKERREHIRGIANTVINKRRQYLEENKAAKDDNTNLLSLLLKSSTENGGITNDEIIDQFVTFLMAGMDSTGHLVTMAVYYLGQYPEYKAQVMEEIKKYYTHGKIMSVDDLNKLEFMMIFLKEVLRMVTPIGATLPRRVVRDVKIQDVSLKKDDLVCVNYFYNNFNPKYFTDPHQFNPNRWKTKESAEAYTFLPFSAGPRNCIGQHLALLEARMILCEFLTMYDYEIKEGYKLKMCVRFLYEPEEKLLLNLTPKTIA